MATSSEIAIAHYLFIKKKAECDEDIHLQQEDERDKAKTPIGANHVTRIAGDLLMDFS